MVITIFKFLLTGIVHLFDESHLIQKLTIIKWATALVRKAHQVHQTLFLLITRGWEMLVALLNQN